MTEENHPEDAPTATHETNLPRTDAKIPSPQTEVAISRLEGQLPRFETMAVDPFVQMIAIAARDPQTDVAKLNALYDLMARRKADQAKAAFNAAISLAKGEIGPVFKNRRVKFTSAKGTTDYRHEDFAEVSRTVDQALSRHGLSYRFRSEQPAANRLRITCIIAHAEGHSEETVLEGPNDDSGNKNGLQQIGSAGTYLQRMTLKLALGLSASEDDDGRAAGEAIPAKMNDEDLAIINKAIADTNTNVEQFLDFLQADSIETLNEVQWRIAMNWLAQKQARAKKQAEKTA